MYLKVFLTVPALAISLTSIVTAVDAKAPVRGKSSSSAVSRGPSTNYAPYLTRLRGKIISHWEVPNGKNHVTVTTIVNADGSAGDVVLVSSPKSADAEIAASEAFAKSQPLEALPGGGQAKLVVTFESNADPHGDSNSNVFTQITPIAGPKAAPAAATDESAAPK